MSHHKLITNLKNGKKVLGYVFRWTEVTKISQGGDKNFVRQKFQKLIGQLFIFLLTDITDVLQLASKMHAS